MTEQYGQTNINNPRLVRSFAAISPPISVQLTFDDDLVVADTTVDTIGFTLPLASQFPAWEIIIKATNAASSGNSVLVTPQAGETIDGAAFILMATDQQALFLKSDGTNWRVISNFDGGAVSGISLDLTYDPTAVADAPPVLFTTWLTGIIPAIAAIPGNPLAFPPYTTKYRLNMETFAGIGGGTYDLSNAEIRATVKSAPNGIGVFGGGVILDNVARLNGIALGGGAFFPPFTWSIYDFVEIHDCSFSQSSNILGPGFLSFPISSTVRATGFTEFGLGAVDSLGPQLTVDAYDQCIIRGSSISAAGDLAINVLSGDTSISLAQFVAGTLELNIGGDFTTLPATGNQSTRGDTILFSSGDIDFSAATEQEIYAGGTNPPGTAAQIPAFSTPSRGYVTSKDGYLRGVGIRIPTILIPSLTFDLTVYVEGVPIIIESFTTGSSVQFSEFTFGQYFEADRIEVTITPTSTAPVSTLAGIVVSLRSA